MHMHLCAHVHAACVCAYVSVCVLCLHVCVCVHMWACHSDLLVIPYEMKLIYKHLHHIVLLKPNPRHQLRHLAYYSLVREGVFLKSPEVREGDKRQMHLGWQSRNTDIWSPPQLLLNIGLPNQ